MLHLLLDLIQRDSRIFQVDNEKVIFLIQPFLRALQPTALLILSAFSAEVELCLPPCFLRLLYIVAARGLSAARFPMGCFQ
jgi:hypothetical protein